MCGIYGITVRDPEFINQYIDKCKHRGPDGQSVWHDDTVTLGHNLLSIMADPSVSKQPWRTPKGNILTYNGEIFNYYELKKRYKNFKDTTGCDTELLAWGLDTYGLNFIDEIDSMHGFAYYDINKKEIILSRDHAGIKPVYYAETKEGLVFGSEIKGMLDKVPNSRSMDNLAMSCLAHTGINATRNTMFSGIKKLLAGETIIYNISNKKIRSRKRIFIKPISNVGFDPEGFRSMAQQTVKMCSIGKRKIGVFLSGGLDSSLVAYELKNAVSKLQDGRDRSRRIVNTFTNRMKPNVIRGGEDYNEDSYCANILANENNFNHTEVIITPKVIENHWDDSIYFLEQPAYNPSLAMYCYTNKVLHDNGIVVTMAGDMGDEILGGYPKYWKLRKLEIKSWAAVVNKWLDRIKRPITHINPTDSGLMPWLLVDKNTLREELIKCYPDDLWNPEDPVASYMALDCVTQVPEEFFNRNDKYGMAYGMEGRFPLATKMFMQYCMNIHSSFKIGSGKGNTKMLSKIAYAGTLPEIIINKQKTGWTVPLQHWWSKSNKADIPAMIVKDWIKTYKINVRSIEKLI